ncbi:MAG: hypothetical protein WBL29_05595 [Burkholderiales bacterium]
MTVNDIPATWRDLIWTEPLGKVFAERDALRAEVERLGAVIAQHDLCHNQHGKVGARDFADGCTQEQRKHYGCAPDADDSAEAIALLRTVAVPPGYAWGARRDALLAKHGGPAS